MTNDTGLFNFAQHNTFNNARESIPALLRTQFD